MTFFTVSKKSAKGLLAGAVCLLGVSCSDQRMEPTDNLRAGMELTIKAYGEYFKSKILEISDGVLTWETTWGERMVSRHKMYKNIFYIMGKDEGRYFVNDFNHEDLEALFPLEENKEVVFSGQRYLDEEEKGSEFWAHISVVGSSTIDVKDVSYDVFIIDVSLEIMTAEGSTLHHNTLWQAKENGLNLKSKFDHEDQAYWSRVIGIEMPYEQEQNQNNLGTTLIDFAPADNGAGEKNKITRQAFAE